VTTFTFSSVFTGTIFSGMQKDNDTAYVMVVRVQDLPVPYNPKAVQKHCHYCKKKVWLGTDVLDHIAKTYPEVSKIHCCCPFCVHKISDDHDETLSDLARGSIPLSMAKSIAERITQHIKNENANNN